MDKTRRSFLKTILAGAMAIPFAGCVEQKPFVPPAIVPAETDGAVMKAESDFSQGYHGGYMAADAYYKAQDDINRSMKATNYRFWA